MTISQAFARYEIEALYQKGMTDKTMRNYKSSLRSFINCNTDVSVRLITYEHVIRWKQYMLQRGNAKSSVASDLSKLRNVLKYLRKHGVHVLDPDMVELPKVPKNEVIFLDYTEIQQFIDAAERPRDKAIIACLFSTGCRISELLNLNRGSIRNGEAMVLGKGGKYRPVYFDGTAQRYLDDYLNTRKDKLKPLFLSGQCRRITPGRVNQLFHEIINTTDIEKRVTPHVLRHSFATDMFFNGAPMRATQELLGHSDISTTQRYVHITDKHKKESFARYHSS